MSIKVFIVGDHPLSTSGNAGMSSALISKLDPKKYQFTYGFVGNPDLNYQALLEKVPRFPLVDLKVGDEWGKEFIFQILCQHDFHIFMIVGLDIWRYATHIHKYREILTKKNIKWVWLFPYDNIHIRTDAIEWINQIDYPCVYSEYGFNKIKDHVHSKLRYFRPPLHFSDIWKPKLPEEKQKLRREWFGATPDDFVFGFIGNNQFRKDPLKVLKAFSLVNKAYKNTYLYLHTDTMQGVFNLNQYTLDCKIDDNYIFRKPDRRFTPIDMVEVYNAIDCLVLPSLQEGLSWTPLEAMLCGTPVIASESTAHIELLEGAGSLVPCTNEAYLPIDSPNGAIWVDTYSCKAQDLADAMIELVINKRQRLEMINAGFKKSSEWMDKVSDINALFDEILRTEIEKLQIEEQKIKAILFMQHSSAGDVLMSTQCLKGIKEKHPNLPLHYMTQPIFQDIVKNNPYVDEIVDWDTDKASRYELVYNPHGEKILPGGWNNLDVTLYSMYPYFCRVQADRMFIQDIVPEAYDFIGKVFDFIVLNTAGASVYRQYAHMAEVVKDIPYKFVQLGAKNDPLVNEKNVIDLRGKTTFRESAWIMTKAIAAVTIDSFCSHLAGCVGTPQVCLFGPAPARVTKPRFQKNKEAKPYVTKGLTCLQPNMLEVCAITSHCWSTPGEKKHNCFAPCINSINPYEVKEALLDIIKEYEDYKEFQS